MERKYNLNDLALMTGFSTRTLRNYLLGGILKGEKVDGVWRFSDEELDAFFNDPYVKEGLRIKRNGVVYDFLADRTKKTARTCTVLDIPATLGRANRISAFFCDKMNDASDVVFTFDYAHGKYSVSINGEPLSVNNSTSFDLCASKTEVKEVEFKGSGKLSSILGVESTGYMVRDSAGHWYATIADAIAKMFS